MGRLGSVPLASVVGSNEVFSSQNEAIAAGGYFTAIENSSDALNNVVAGASETSNAMVNAVNTALACFRNVISGGQA